MRKNAITPPKMISSAMPPHWLSLGGINWAADAGEKTFLPFTENQSECYRVCSGNASRLPHGPGGFRSNANRQCATTLRYRCQVACPSTGIATARPTKNGKEPRNRTPATIMPHSAMGTGFATTALIDV